MTKKKQSASSLDDENIAKGTEKIFERSSGFLVLGLTGRTGSGCSTVAELLCKSSFQELQWRALPNPPTNHEDRKDRIVEHWLKERWTKFRKIQVSQVILSFALEADPDEFTAQFRSKPPSKLRAALEEAHHAASKSLKTLSHVSTAARDAIIDADKFYFNTLPNLATELKDFLSLSAYTALFQQLGDNVRRSGSPLKKEIDPENLFAIPRRIEKLIELGQRSNELTSTICHYFVIDAIRHPYEIHYLREKINRLFIIAVTTDEESRQHRLLHRAVLKSSEIKALDDKEYPKNKRNLTGYDQFVSQNIQDCISAADIYISNIGYGSELTDLHDLTRNLCRYIALAQHPGLVTPTPEERCMQAAFAVRLNSGCISRQVGAVITDETFSIKAVGWNDVPLGQVPCLLRYSHDLYTKQKDYEAFSKFELTDKEFREKGLGAIPAVASKREEIHGRHITYCFKSVYNELVGEKNQVHTRSLHAEENAFLQISKSGGQGISAGFLFSTASPCELCAKKAYQLGISRVYYIDPYPGISASHIFGAGKNPPDVILFSGVIGRAYHQLYEPIMPYKDEMATLLLQQPLPTM